MGLVFSSGSIPPINSGSVSMSALYTGLFLLPIILIGCIVGASAAPESMLGVHWD